MLSSGQILDRVTGEFFLSLEVSESKAEMKERSKRQIEGRRKEEGGGWGRGGDGKGGERASLFQDILCFQFLITHLCIL